MAGLIRDAEMMRIYILIALELSLAAISLVDTTSALVEDTSDGTETLKNLFFQVMTK